MQLRSALDALYFGAGCVAALLLVGTLAMVVTGIAGRLIGFHVPGTDAYAGYCMAGSGFLALAHTLKRREHIRVTLLLEHSSAAGKHALELWSLAVAALLALLFAIFSVRLAYQSWDFNDISTASDATPLWIPQLAMAAGTVILAIALVDELILEWRRRRDTAPPSVVTFNE
jgi:TRAP-type C4-dicarboxylate transport system permease small subunit